MAGIIANSIDVYMEEADTSTPNEEDGFVKDVEISFAIVHPSEQTSWTWDVTRPDGAEAELVVADDYATARLRPDLGGAWGLTCFVNETKLYSLILNVLDEGATTPVHGQRLVRRHPDNVLTPHTGLVMFQSSTTGYESVKNSAGQVRQLGGGSSGVPVANIAAIATTDFAIYQDGTLFWLETLKCHAYLETTTAAAVTGERWQVTVAEGELARQLVRLDPAPRAANPWLVQDAWFVDPVSGDDETNGATSGTAIATFAEFMRRMGESAITQPTTLDILSDGASLVGTIRTSGAGWLIITGRAAKTTRLETTVTSFTAITGNEYNVLAVDGVDFTSHCGYYCRITSGASSGSGFWIGKQDPGGTTGTDHARVSWSDVGDPFAAAPFTSYGFSQHVPAPGDSIVIESYVAVSCLNLLVEATGNSLSKSVFLHELSVYQTTDAVYYGAVGYLQPQAYRCKIHAARLAADAMWSDCWSEAHASGVIHYGGGQRQAFYGGVFGGEYWVLQDGTLGPLLVQGCAVRVGVNSKITVGWYVGFFDSWGDAFWLYQNAQAVFTTGPWLGSGNAGFGINVRTIGAKVIINSTSKPTITGTAGDWCQPDQVQKTWAQAPEFSLTYDSGILNLP